MFWVLGDRGVVVLDVSGVWVLGDRGVVLDVSGVWVLGDRGVVVLDVSGAVR